MNPYQNAPVVYGRGMEKIATDCATQCNDKGGNRCFKYLSTFGYCGDEFNPASAGATKRDGITPLKNWLEEASDGGDYFNCKACPVPSVSQAAAVTTAQQQADAVAAAAVSNAQQQADAVAAAAVTAAQQQADAVAAAAVAAAVAATAAQRLRQQQADAAAAQQQRADAVAAEAAVAATAAQRLRQQQADAAAAAAQRLLQQQAAAPPTVPTSCSCTRASDGKSFKVFWDNPM